MPDPDLQQRVAALEARVAELEARLSRARRRPSEAPPARRAKAPSPGFKWAEAKSEDVLGKVGIGLLLVGVLFLLKYSIDQGLLTPAVRVAGAGALGAGLVAGGLRLRGSRPALGRLLTGGGIAALFGTLWTASSLYPLLPAPAALGGMVLVAALAFGLALRESDAALSVVGALGALMTPLLLYREPGQMGLLMGYTALVVVGAGAVYARRGWPALAGAAALGGWGVITTAWSVGVLPTGAAATGFDRTAFAAGVAATWLATGVVPLARAAMRTAPAAPTSGPVGASAAELRGGAFASWPPLLRPDALAAFAAPLFAFGFTDATWSLSALAATLLALALAGGYGAAAWALRRRPLFGPALLASGALVAWAAGRALGDPDALLMATLVVLGCGLVWLARRERRGDLASIGHAVALLGTLALAGALYVAGGVFDERPPAHTGAETLQHTLSGLLAVGALGLVGFRSARGSAARTGHLLAAHAVAVVLLRMLLAPLADGAALTSGAWGVYGIALVAVGLRLRDDLVRQIGLGTLLLTVAKVLVFDLADISALWRVFLFMGFGGLLLLVSYLVPSLLGRGEPARPADGAPPAPSADPAPPPQPSEPPA